MTADQSSIARYISPSASNKDYVQAVGQAIYSFAGMEWNIICIARRLNPDFVKEEMFQQTSGRVIKVAKACIESNIHMFDGAVQDRVVAATERALALVELRNDLIHAYPCTSPDNKQVLTRRKSGAQEIWYLPDIDEAIKAFDETAADLNDLLHKHAPQDC